MRLKITVELRLPGTIRPLRSEVERFEASSFKNLARSFQQNSGPVGGEVSGKEIIGHLASLDPRLTDDFLKSI